MRRRILGVCWALVAGLVIVIVSETVDAQPMGEPGESEITRVEVREVVKRVQKRVNNFAKKYTHSLDRSRDKDGRFNSRVRELESAADELSRDFDATDTWTANIAGVRHCLKIASTIERDVRNRSYSAATTQNWKSVQSELNTLANIYELPRVGIAAYNNKL
ncbi:MAG: hypothetical protein WBD22_02530 [Pyrinomonadaceae bacterium]